ncbi:hypothetical protein GOP47_0006355 [Adiantum capillus-veneris]|uniref:Uncharacterized protein n=1 Tax=Adiantum capillus-veneris TaxID=13818 RepID=A0A9D4ZKB7_ADICA|nr:hypothetical protein GOP47_0006355 [Adiantum capillus-veneris]
MGYATFIDVLLAIILPPLGVFLRYGCGIVFWICLLLTILGYIPGIIYAIYVLSAGSVVLWRFFYELFAVINFASVCAPLSLRRLSLDSLSFTIYTMYAPLMLKASNTKPFFQRRLPIKPLVFLSWFMQI